MKPEDDVKQELIKQVKAKLDKNINGELTIGKIQLNIFNDFPKLSLTLRQLSVVLVRRFWCVLELLQPYPDPPKQ